MKKWFGKIFLPFWMCIVGVIAVVTGCLYFRFIADRIYEDSTSHLKEIYGQVNRSFGIFIERNWGLLENWSDYLVLVDNEDSVPEFMEEKKEKWGFSEFYFIGADRTCMAPDGSVITAELTLWDELMQKRQPVMDGISIDRNELIVFAVPAIHGTYRGFDYDAIAITYTNADLADSLNVDAFSGKAKCFVMHEDGSVLLSTQTGGNVFENYLVYLNAATDLTDEELEDVRNDWENETSGLLQCNIGDVSQCILYMPVGYQNYVLLSVVPEDTMSAGFLSVQKMTANILLLLFLLVGVSLFVVVIIRGRSQNRRSRLELQYRERMFDVLSNTVDDIFIMLDHDCFHVDYVSPNIERLLGISAESAKKNIRIMEECVVGDEVIISKAELEKIPVQGSVFREHEYMNQNTGERRWYRITAYHMDIQDVAKYIIVLSDRTRDQKMNQDLQEALAIARSANEAKSSFLSNMSHDIRTPMNAIVGFSVLLEKDADKPEKVREYTRKITASSNHLLSLINDVLDMSKIESGKTSLNVDKFSLPELFEELHIILDPQAKAKEQTFRIYVQGTLHEELIGDKLRLNQILINLLSNAIKYTQVGGKITFTISELPNPAKQFVKLRFVVQDNGMGMSEEFQQHIFAPFSRENSSITNKIQGTGLGMAITKNLVELMGGIIHVESETGVGSTFTVELSFTLPEPEQKEKWYLHKVSRLLVADDEEEICHDIQELMRDSGVEVTCVTSGAAAVEKAVRAHEQHEDFHVILLDWKMPGMNGMETARRIREQVKADVPILVLTSYDWSEIEEEAKASGINAFLAKPFFVSTFWQTIRPLFSDQTQQQETAFVPEGVMKGKLFLVAEDNELNAEILTEMLHMEGAECEVAVNGQDAAELFLHSQPGHFDMILMDVQMPVMNGYEATRQIRSSAHPEAKTIPIAAMTANTFAEDVRNAIDAGMNGHLAKPINMTAVRELVSRLLYTEGKGDHT